MSFLSRLNPTFSLPQSLFFFLLLLGSFNVLAKDRVTVFGAASLTNALTEIGQQFEREYTDKQTQSKRANILFSFASSSTLARQIAQGAPAHIYLSANQKWLDYLVTQNAVSADSKVTLLTNELVLIAPINSEIDHIEMNEKWDITAALSGSRLAVGDPDHVPAGRYAQQALTSLQLWPQANPLLARASNVRAALALVERGEAPLGIVYATDALISKKVKIVGSFPEDSHTAIQYPMILVNNGTRLNTSSHAFYQYLQSAQAATIFNKHGFKKYGVKQHSFKTKQ